jgi:hypothetical protein
VAQRAAAGADYDADTDAIRGHVQVDTGLAHTDTHIDSHPLHFEFDAT